MVCLLTGAALSLRAQTAVPPPMPGGQLLSDAQLDQLLGPLALYPDPLIAEMLPASTFPTEIVLADRYISGGGDPNQIGEQPWDPSVQALAHYPNVLQWMDQNLGWTTEVGQVFLNQLEAVMDSIQRLRQSAYTLGNLQSTPQQEVIDQGGEIEIVPVDPEMIYVPVYQPAQVYDAAASGGPFVNFGVGCAIGPWLNCDFDWGNQDIIVWSRNHPRPPNWWQEPSLHRNAGHVTVWHYQGNPRTIMASDGDRGWGGPNNPVVVATISRSFGDSAAPRGTPAEGMRPGAPAPDEYAPPVNRPESNGAFIGSESSHDARSDSNRGRQSMQTVTRAAPVFHPAPVSRPAAPSGGGGGHGSGSGPRH
ncbi:MAG: DUF3300 domain-containing protein [Limisphaerales bacterium]